jgi:hypothetical protein
MTAHRAHVGPPTLTQDAICSGAPADRGRKKIALYSAPGLSSTHLSGS